jgi:type VI secretion system protein ImpG
MFIANYEQELEYLRKLVLEFSERHPMSAPMVLGHKPDPSIERLIEGTAFLNAFLQERINDNVPEIVHGLCDNILPHHLRSIPSMSIVHFQAKPGLREELPVPAGISVASVPIGGKHCLFQTCFPVEVHPARLTSVSVEEEMHDRKVCLSVELSGINVSQWRPKKFLLFFDADLSRAARVFSLLFHYLEYIIVSPVDNGGKSMVLGRDSLVAPGFDAANTLLPFPADHFSGYRFLHEYFLFPEKFLFLEIRGWELWRNRGTGTKFEITFVLRPGPISVLPLDMTDFVLFATPVVNLFTARSDSATLDHRSGRVKIYPDDRHAKIYSINTVSSYTQGSVKKKDYFPAMALDSSNHGDDIYSIDRTISLVDSSAETHLSFPDPPMPGEPSERLLVEIMCTDSSLPEGLNQGDISVGTKDSPELTTFANITKPTQYIDPPLTGETLWKLLAHSSLNYLSCINAENLKETLGLYVSSTGRDQPATVANLTKLEGIIAVERQTVRRMIRGSMTLGWEIKVTADGDHFEGIGGLILFGYILERFLREYCAKHSFIRLIIEERKTKNILSWPEHYGLRQVI